MRKVLLECVRFPTPRGGHSVHTVINSCLSRWDLQKKPCAITSDNGSDMCNGIKIVQEIVLTANLHVRCLAHIASLSKIHKSVCSVRQLINIFRLSVHRRELFQTL